MNKYSQPNLTEGETLKNIGQASAAKGQSEWIKKALSQIKWLNGFKKVYTADDVWASLEACNVPEPRHGSVMASAIKEASKQGLLRPTGQYQKSTRKSRRGSMIQIYEGIR